MCRCVRKPVGTACHRATGFDLVADLRAGAMDADELERARRPALEQLNQHAPSNAYWLSVLAQAQSQPDRATRMTLAYTDTALRAVSLDDIRAAAVKWFDPENLLEIDILPDLREAGPG